MQTVFSAQAKNAEVEAQQINQIGLSLQAFSSIDFNDTFQVVLSNAKSSKNHNSLDLRENRDSESSGDGTGSTDYEVIQQANSSEDSSYRSLHLLKSESSGTAQNMKNKLVSAEQHVDGNMSYPHSTASLCKALSLDHSAQSKGCELKAKALVLALHAELRGLQRAFTDRHKLIQSYKVTQIVIDLKRTKLMQHQDESGHAIESEID